MNDPHADAKKICKTLTFTSAIKWNWLVMINDWFSNEWFGKIDCLNNWFIPDCYPSQS